MKLRHLLAFAAVAMLALPASAATRIYDLDGDQSTSFPTDGVILRPGTVSGIAIIEQGPLLTTLLVTNAFTDAVGGTITTMIPGTTVFLDSAIAISPNLGSGQDGTGSVDTTIDWNTLTGWTQTGRLFCFTNCPGGCPTGVSSCVPFVGFDFGTGPPAPLKSTSFDTDTWTFTGDGSGGGFSAPSIETTNLAGGAVTANILIAGVLRPIVPALPLLGVAGLGAALVYLGTRAIRRK